jgi:cytochrome b561
MTQWRNSSERFGAVAQSLHWSMFVLIAAGFVGALVIDEFPRDSAGKAFMLATHESLGVTALLLACARLSWKLAGATPPGIGTPWQQRLARLAHGALYALMFVIPVVGYVVACARGHDPAFFGLSVPSVIGKDRALARSAKEIHEILAWTLVGVVAVHAAAAVWHQLVLRDGVLARMLPVRLPRAEPDRR